MTIKLNKKELCMITGGNGMTWSKFWKGFWKSEGQYWRGVRDGLLH